MTDKNLYLGEFEEIVLLAVARLGTNAYGVTIRRTVEEVAERSTSYGAIYATLDRLEDKGMVSSRLGDATPQRGGRAKRYFKLEAVGQLALDLAQRTRDRLRDSVTPDFQPNGPWGSVTPDFNLRGV
jgi:DNA-binding PadR family transcriptional regulator